MKIDRRTQRILEDAMRGLKGSAAKEQARQLASRFGVSHATIYRRTEHLRTRKRRSDRKERFQELSEASDETYALSLTMLYDMTAKQVTEIAAANGRDLGVSEATYNRWLRQAGLSRLHLQKHQRPARQFEAARPNDLWQIDFTRSAQFYIADDGGISAWSVGERKDLKKRKGYPLWVASGIDDHSRARYRRAYPGTRAVFTLDFVARLCSPKEDPRHPLGGRPRVLYSDNDPVIANGIVQPALELLDIEWDPHLPVSAERPDAARGTGKVERQFRTLKDEEKVSQIRRWQSIEEFNCWLLELDIVHGNTTHSTTGVMPFERWCDIRAHELRQMPREEILDRLFRQQRTARISAYMRIRVRGREWQLPYAEPFISLQGRGEKLTYFVHPKKQDRIFAVVDGVEHKIDYKQPAPDVADVSGGAIKSVPETAVDRARKVVAGLDHSETRIPMPLEGTDFPIWMPRAGRGEEFDESTMAAPQAAGVTRAATIRNLQERRVVSRPITPEEAAWVDAVFAGRSEIAEEEVAAMMEGRERRQVG